MFWLSTRFVCSAAVRKESLPLNKSNILLKSPESSWTKAEEEEEEDGGPAKSLGQALLLSIVVDPNSPSTRLINFQ